MDGFQEIARLGYDGSMWNDVIGLLALFSIIVLVAYYIWLVLFIITDDRSTDTTLMWLVILLVLPFIGLALYYFLGRDYRDDSSALHKKCDMR